MSIRVGFQFSGWPLGPAEGQRFFEFVDRAEALGVDSLWFNDRVVSTTMALGPIVSLAAVAARTKRIKFGSAVLILPTRNPVEVAKQIATIDFLSDGRMLPAFGLGPDDEREYEAAGIAKRERPGRMDEAIGLLRRLWTEDHVDHHGRYYHLTDVTITPKPVQKPSLPIWFGGRSPATYRRTGRLGDGWLASSITPEEVRHGIEAIKLAAHEAERKVDDDHYGVIVSCRIARSMAEARDGIVQGQLRPRPDAAIEAYSAFGTIGECRAMLERYIEAGAHKFVLRPVCAAREFDEQVERMAKELTPLVETIPA